MATSKITTVCDQHGKPINATFQVEVSDGKTSVIVRSRGGTKGSANEQNTEYNLGVELILSRLKAKGCKLVDAVLDTKYTKSQGLSHDERRLNVGKYPIALSSQNLSKLTKGLRDAQRGVRKPGAKGLGNNTKRMRLFVEGMLGDAEKIAAILSGRGEAAGNTLSVLNGITSEHIKQAVVEYAIHQIDHPYKDSTDYDIIIDDRPYPPVAIMGIASTLAEGTEEYPRLRGGEGTPCFEKFKELRFKIVQKGTHQGIKSSRKKPRSWPDCLEVLDYKKWGYDPRELFSLCLRIRSDYTLSKYLGKSASGKTSGAPFKFILGARDNFRRVDVGFQNNVIGLYLVVDSTEDDYVESVRSALQEKLNAELDWPSTTGKVNRAFNIKLKTKQQCDAVVEWLSSERVPNTRRLRIRESKTAKLKSEKPELFEQTSDNEKLEANTSRLLEEGLDEEPAGNPNPERSDPRESKGAFKRDPEVIAWVKQRAGGICELCEMEGPFLDKDNQPFLEVHHILPLADDGRDTVDNAVALCPNCHRACHHGQNSEDLKNRLLQKISAIK